MPPPRTLRRQRQALLSRRAAGGAPRECGPQGRDLHYLWRLLPAPACYVFWPAGGTSPARLASSWPPLWPCPGGHVRGRSKSESCPCNEGFTWDTTALLQGAVLAPAPAVAHAASSLPHGSFFRPPLGGRYGVNTRLDSLPQASRNVHEPNRTQRRPPCPTATTPLAPRLGVCSDQQEDDERLQPYPALFLLQVRSQQGLTRGLSAGCYGTL